ncbi:MAG: hypothetical protein GF309_08850 [Candidatus Lokiarchaeota archaeon]|nr:hypothetical protein [Candidatus Lokiarchaeota archaeon]
MVGLEEDETYWFAIIAYDDVGNYGEVSNIAYGTTTIPTLPDTGLVLGLAIGDLAGAGGAIVLIVWFIRKRHGI